MRRLTSPFCVAIIFAAAFGTAINLPAQENPAAGTVAPGNKLDLTFVPTDAIAAVVVQPRRVLAGPEAEFYPTELLTVLGNKNVGFDPRDIQQMMMVIGLPDGPQMGAGPPMRFGIVFRFAKPIDIGKVGTKIAPHGSDANWDGVKVRADNNPQGGFCGFVDDRTAIFSNEEGLHWLLSAKPGDSSLRKLLSEADDVPDLQALTSIEALRPMLAPIMGMAAQQLPPPLLPLTKLPTLADTVTISVKQGLHGMIHFKLDAATADDKSAQELEGVIKQMLEMARTMALEQLSYNAGASSDDPEISQAMMQYAGRISERIVAALQPTRGRNRVILKGETPYGPAGIGVMTALLLPAVQAAREAAMRVQSSNNLKQIGLALIDYEDAHHILPAQAKYDSDGKPLLSWRVGILPYIEEKQLYDQFHLDEPWDSPNNIKLLDKMPDVFKHPKFNKPGMTLYQAAVGKGCAFDGKQGNKFASFTDGTSKTIMVVETSPAVAVPWTKPEDWQFDEQHPTKDLGGLFAGDIVNCLFADCHVEGITKSIDPNIFKAMITRNGGEVIPEH
jgi:prepilin-type processing-associated H-X9-DG protein